MSLPEELTKSVLTLLCAWIPIGYHGVQLYKRGIGKWVGPYQLRKYRNVKSALEQLMHPLMLSDTRELTETYFMLVATRTKCWEYLWLAHWTTTKCRRKLLSTQNVSASQ